MSFEREAGEGSADDPERSEFDWHRWWRVPRGLPVVRDLPQAAPGRVHLLHHANGSTVAVYDEQRGRAEPVFELADPEYMRDPRVAGRYLPLRSGVLVSYGVVVLCAPDAVAG